MAERPPRTPEHWESRYVDGNTPWDTGRVDRHLEAMVEARPLARCRALDVGCGTGTEAVWLAARGFTVTGVDFSETAIAQARERAKEAGVSVDFAVGSFPDQPGAFGLAFDCGWLPHGLGGGGTIRVRRRTGPVPGAGGIVAVDPRLHRWPTTRPRATADVGGPSSPAAIESRFELLSLTTSYYDAQVPTPAPGVGDARSSPIVTRRRE